MASLNGVYRASKKDGSMQINLLSRYHIRNHAVLGKDYDFADHNPLNFRYNNILVHNTYFGVEIEHKENGPFTRPVFI